MRVLVDYRPALRARTGVGEYVHELVRALAAPGGPAPPGDISVFTASWKDRPSTTLVSELRVPVVDRRLPVRALTWAWNRLEAPPVEWLAGRFDVVHAATPLAIPARHAHAVVTIHDLHFLRHPERVAAEMRRDFPALVRRHAARARAIVVSSVFVAGDVAGTLEVPRARIHVCRPGAPAWAREVRTARQGRPPRHVLFIGTLEARKDVGTLLDAYERLRARRPDAPPLVLAGRATPDADTWRQRATRGALRGHVHMPGYVDETTRRRLFAEAHLLVLPSLDEGFGLPVLEAMACGVPVVVSAAGSLPEVAGDAASPVAPGDVEGFCAAMEALLDPAAAADAARRGLARAADFHWDDCARQAWAAYRAACEGPA